MDGSCRMIGADYEIKDIPGYLPLVESPELSKVFEEVSKAVLGEENASNKDLYKMLIDCVGDSSVTKAEHLKISHLSSGLVLDNVALSTVLGASETYSFTLGDEENCLSEALVFGTSFDISQNSSFSSIKSDIFLLLSSIFSAKLFFSH